MHQLINKTAYNIGNLAKQVKNTTIDAFCIVVQGVTGADKDAAIALIYAGMKVKAIYTPGAGSEGTAFVTGMYLDEFQEYNEVAGGALQQAALSNGAFIELGGSLTLRGDQNINLELDWSAVDLSGLGDAVTTGATVQIHRVYKLPTGAFDTLRMYYGKSQSAAQEEHIPPVPNCNMILFSGTPTAITLDLGGHGIDLDPFVLQQMTNYGYQHEESGDAPFLAVWNYNGSEPPFVKATIAATAQDRIIFIGNKETPELSTFTEFV